MTPDQARLEIAAEIGPDIGAFTPPGEKHFIGATLMILFGGALLYSFLKAFGKKLGEKLGEKAADISSDYIISKIENARAMDKDRQKALLIEEQQRLEGLKRLTMLSEADVDGLGREVEKQLALALANQAPEDVAGRIANRVRTTSFAFIKIEIREG
jgi:hypothetical protein